MFCALRSSTGVQRRERTDRVGRSWARSTAERDGLECFGGTPVEKLRVDTVVVLEASTVKNGEEFSVCSGLNVMFWEILLVMFPK